MKVLAVAVAVLALVAFAHADDVIVGTPDNFDRSIQTSDLVLVEFYAPWCGHCKRLEPEFAKAASALKEDNIVLIKFDADEHKEFAGKFGIRGYPTLKIFRNYKSKKNQQTDDYNGPREANGIIEYLRSQNGPAAKPLTSVEEHKKHIRGGAVTVIAYFEDDADPDSLDFVEIAEANREKYNFGIVRDASLFKEVGHENEIVLYRDPNMVSKKHDDASAVYTDKVTPSRLAAWIESNAMTLVNHKHEKSLPILRGANLPILTMYYNVDYKLDPKGSNYLANRLRRVAKDFRDQLVFAVAAKKDYGQEVGDFGFEQSGTHVGVIDGAGRKYKMETEWSVDNMRAFVEKYVAGDVEAWIKSEPLPGDNTKPVKTLVARNFDEIVNDDSKDVLIEFYAPWCGHCKSLAPKWDELGEKFADNDNIVIAKMDATANDIPPEFNVRGYPTLFWVPANNKKNPVKYEGGREVSDFASYIKKHATVSLKQDL